MPKVRQYCDSLNQVISTFVEWPLELMIIMLRKDHKRV